MKETGNGAGINKEFNKKMQEAAYIYEKSRHENSLSDHDFIKRLVQDKRKARRNRIVRTVTIFTLAVMTGIASVVWFNSDGAYGGKRILGKCIAIVSPLDTEEEIDDDGNVTRITTAHDKEDIKAIKNQIKDIVEPAYIPDNYSFRTLTVREASQLTELEYLYKDVKKGNILLVTVKYYDYDPDIMVMGDAYISGNTGKTMYVVELPETNEFIITEIGDEYDCIVSGKGNKEIGIQVMESLREY